MTRILDVPSYDPEKVKATCIVTLHQFLQYFKDEGGLQNVDAVAAECKYNQFVLVIFFSQGNRKWIKIYRN